MGHDIGLVFELSARLVTEGLVEPDDAGDAAVALASELERSALLPSGSTADVRARSLWPRQRALVQRYLSLTEGTGDARRRGEIKRQLGVSRDQIHRWARKHFGPGYLSRAMPGTVSESVRALLDTTVWRTTAEISYSVGCKQTSARTALRKLAADGRVERRKGADHRWQYRLKPTD